MITFGTDMEVFLQIGMVKYGLATGTFEPQTLWNTLTTPICPLNAGGK
jgi:hypothetical protein